MSLITLIYVYVLLSFVFTFATQRRMVWAFPRELLVKKMINLSFKIDIKKNSLYMDHMAMSVSFLSSVQKLIFLSRSKRYEPFINFRRTLRTTHYVFMKSSIKKLLYPDSMDSNKLTRTSLV